MKRHLWAALLAAAAWAEPAPERNADAEAFIERARRIKEWVAQLDSKSQAEREEAASRLMATGGDAIPHVLQAIHDKDAKLQLSVLQKLIEQEHSALPPELRVTEEDLKALILELGIDPARNKKEGRAWLYTKYLEACEDYRKGQVDAAHEKASAILTLEPFVDFSPMVKKLRIQCEEQQIQLRLVRTTITAAKTEFSDNEIAQFTLTFTNVSSEPVEIWFGDQSKAADPEARELILKNNSFVILHTVRTILYPDGNYASDIEERRISLNVYSISLKAGESRRFQVEIDMMGDPGQKYLVSHSIEAFSRPFGITGATSARQRQLHFKPVTVKVFPGAELENLKAKPLSDLGVAIDDGDGKRAFLLCNVMPEADRSPAVELIIASLKAAKNYDAENVARDHAILRSCLGALTGRSFSTNEAWLEWYEKKDGPKE